MTGSVVLAAACLNITPQASASPAAELCRQYQHMPVTNRLGQTFIIRNDNFGGQPECITNSGDRSNFVVAQSSAGSGDGRSVLAFPYIFLGCSWGLCTPGSGLPARVSQLASPLTNWDISTNASGSWDATYDIWFDKQPITTGQATGAELMIWLNSRGRATPGPRTKIVWADHARWYLHSWITQHAGFKWRLIQFRRVQPVDRVTNLHLSAFIDQLESQHWVRPWYWMLNVDAGFEIWRGGQGLATNWFGARAR
jgi:hypothetical protein